MSELNDLIAQRMEQDADALRAIDDRLADLTLARGVIGCIQEARLYGGLTKRSIDFTPSVWAEMTSNTITLESEIISSKAQFEAAKQKLGATVARVTEEFGIVDLTVITAHRANSDSLVLHAPLF